MKIVVLDDEEKVCNLICALIDWNGLGLTLAGTAADGPGGLDLIRSVHPDLLITDIRMPGMDGLQLIAEAKKILPDLQVIIISGYSQFDYAQTAIRCGVVNYLLKPVKQQEMNETLRKMVDEYHRRRLELSKAQQLEAQVKQTAVQKQKNALNSAALHSDSPLAGEIGLPFPVQIFVVKLDGRTPPYDLQAGKVLTDKLEDFIHMTVRVPHVCVFYASYCILALTGECKKNGYAEKLLAWCKAQTELFRNFTLTVAAGVPVTAPAEYYDSIRCAFQGISRRLEDGTLCIYTETAVLPPVSFDCAPFIKNMFASMLQDSREKFIQTCSSFHTAVDFGRYAPYQYETVLLDFGRLVLEEARCRLGTESYETVSAQLCLIELAPSKNQLWENIRLFADSVYDAVVAENHERYVRPVREAQEYIAAHYSDTDISLNSVAGYVGLNSTYFSGLFKKNCNTGFAEYLQNLRLEKAKELLVKTKKSIKEIAADVGYADPKHFAKVFRGVTGIKPNEYRKLYE